MSGRRCWIRSIAPRSLRVSGRRSITCEACPRPGYEGTSARPGQARRSPPRARRETGRVGGELALVGRNLPRAVRSPPGTGRRRHRRMSSRPPRGAPPAGPHRLAADAGEHLSASCVDDRNRVRCAGRESAPASRPPARPAPHANASVRAVSPHPQPGEASRADADRDPLDLGVRTPPRRRSASRSSSTVTGLEVSSPSTSPSQTSALVARSVAVSNARISIP